MRWPETQRQLRLNAPLILKGRVLSIDPASGSSSDTGWAYWEAGQLVQSGLIKVPVHAPLSFRLRELARTIREEVPAHDVLFIEAIRQNPTFRGAPVEPLLKAVGAILASSEHQLCLEVAPMVWKRWAISLRTYHKTDEQDAIHIGMFLMQTTAELAKKDEKPRKAPSTRRPNLHRSPGRKGATKK